MSGLPTYSDFKKIKNLRSIRRISKAIFDTKDTHNHAFSTSFMEIIMKQLKRILGFAIFVLIAFISCESTPEADVTSSASQKVEKEKKPSKEPIFEAWKGEWQTLQTGLDDASLENVYKDTASKMPNYTVDGLKATVASMYVTGTNIVKVKFDGSSKVIFTALTDGAETKIPADYIYIGKKAIPGYDDFYWECFEIAKAVRGLTNAKYLILCKVHGKDEGMEHFHCRFNGRSIDSAIAGTNWPTFVSASMKKSEIVKYHSENIANYAKMFPSSPFENFAKQGKWINRRYAYSNTSKEVDAAYQKLIKEYAGKNNGKNFTKAELVKMLEESFGTTDFDSVDFDVSNGKNEMKIFKDGKVIFASSYKRVAENAAKPGMLAVKADKEDAGKYTLISFTEAHGSPLHSHFWYGKTNEDIKALTIKPTIIPAKATNAEIAAHIETAAKRILEDLK